MSFFNATIAEKYDHPENIFVRKSLLKQMLSSLQGLKKDDGLAVN
jgi:hypothetical protein